jgi:uncharacterized DUF497 family protein
MIINNLRISKRIAEKLLEKHGVTPEEIQECFLNRERGFLEDTRLNHYTNPPTLWFIAETDEERLLKVVFIKLIDASYEIKTTYEPNTKEVKIYEQYA